MAEPGNGHGPGPGPEHPRFLEQNAPEVPIKSRSDFTGRTWLFRIVDSWLGVESERRLLLVGKPGTGKSALAVRLVELSLGDVTAVGCLRLSRGFVSAAHFCRARVDPTLDPARVFESLASQLANRLPAFRQALEAGAAERGVSINIVGQATVGTAEAGAEVTGVRISVHVEGCSARGAFDRLLRRPLEAACQDDLEEQVVILVDGLDEALSYDDQPTLVEVLREATDTSEELPPRVRFIFTSRPDRRVTDRMGERVVDLVADAPSGEHDLRDYVDSRLVATDLAAVARRAIAEKVAGAALGNFLYARYVVDDLLASPERLRDPDRLSLPAGLEEHYKEFLERELARRAERWQDRYRPLMGALAVARGDGLMRSHLQGVSALPKSRVDDALGALSQYVSAPTPEGPFRLYHESFRDFLLSNEHYPIYPAEAHGALAALFTTAYRGRWAECTDEYALLNTRTHLTEALIRRDELTNATTGQMEQARTELDSDPEFEAAVAEAQLLVYRTRGFVNHEQELRMVDKWVDSDDTPIVLVVGPPGSGKTTLAAQIVRITRSARYAGQYPGLTANVFAIYSPFDPVRRHGLGEFSSQIINKLTARHRNLLSITYPHDSLTPEGAIGIIQELMWRIREDGVSEKTLVVVDALDEIAVLEPAINDWLARFANMRLPNLRILVTSRDDGSAQRIFPAALRFVLGNLKASEMRDYVIALGVPPDLAVEVAGYSGGSPLWARLLAEDIRSSPDPPEERLQAIVTGNREALVAGLIRRRLASVGPERAQILRRILVTIAKAPAPMTPAEIANALDEPLPAVRAAVATASGLLIADNQGRMSLYHQILVDVLSNFPKELP